MPMLFIISNAFKPLDELFMYPPRLFVRNPTTDNFSSLSTIFSDSLVPFARYLFNTVYLTIATTVGQIIISSMAGYVLENTLSESGYVSRGECFADKNGYLTGIIERTRICREGDGAVYLDGEEWKPISRDTTVSMNFFGFTPEIIEYIRDGFIRFLHDPATDLRTAEYYLPSAVTQMLQDGLCDIKVLRTDAKWYGVTYPEDKPRVVHEIETMISSGIYPDGLWK